MRLAVEGTGYQSAVAAYVTGNLLAADTCRSLSSTLGGCAGMAGDDSIAADFAASYDEAAAESLAALGELTFAFASLGHLTEASLRNLAWADTVSGPPTVADRAVGVRPAPPPSVLGADSSSLPGWANIVLDLLEGVFWPDADTGRLRAAGSAWRAAATSVGLLAAHCSTATSALSDEVSPDTPLAIAVTGELRSRAAALADQLVAVGAACETYADQVDAKRAEMLDLLHELAWELGIGAAVSGALTFLSGGAAAGVAGSAGAARLAAASEEAGGILASLSALTRSTATSLRPVVAGVRDTRAYLSRLSAARRMEMTERGSLRFGRDGVGDLLRLHDGAGGHIWERHVGLTRSQLQQRLVDNPSLELVSTFRTPAGAERAIRELLARNRSQLAEWLAGQRRTITIEARLPSVVGDTLDRAGRMSEVSGIRAFIIRDPALPDGYRIHTCYPQP
ncbi:RNase A-like domain-containing protein [Nocardioides aquiterrae]|uniref:Bacterial CdiA-CT RNAse A domain-containing protein n=1 Tax=Nocardioides aquiterrae TaxID=203799 RepID=A0ABN1UE24_9ACTN